APDGKTFATAGSDKRILLYAVPPEGSWPAEVREHTVWEGHLGSIGCIAFSADSRYLASGTDAINKTTPGELKVWEVASGKPVAALTGHKGDVLSVAFSPAGPILVSGGSDSAVRVWDVPAGKPIAVRPLQSAVRAVAFTPGGKELLTGLAGGAIYLWDTENWMEQAMLRGHNRPVNSLSVATKSPERLAFSTGADQMLRAWNL